jgi:predicted nucleic acid-binding protein
MKVYLDSMAWVYYFEQHPIFFAPVNALVSRTVKRRDEVLASHLVLAEVLVLPKRNGDLFLGAQYRRYFLSSQVTLAPFTPDVAERFASIRATSSRVKPADSIHLALAASANADYFVTYDAKLLSLTVPGIAHICPPEAIA